jgi:sec-independent protein translocase protein TatA
MKETDMHAMGPLQLIVIAAVVLVLFGRGKVSALMGEVGKGISAFKKGVGEGQADLDKAASEATPPVTGAIDVTPVEKDKA